MATNAIRIIKPIDGAILNRHDGEVKGSNLLVEVHVEAPPGARVCVNDIPARWDGQLWKCTVMLTEHRTELIARMELRSETREHRIAVLYDRNSFPRYRMSVDDNIMFLRDIARNATNYHSIFDDPYMAFWREMYRRYGTKVHLNIYYQTVNGAFTLREMPDKFKSEWRENSHWLRLTFHALQDQPARPYRNAPASQLERDFLLVTDEIVRFAGEELLSPFTTIHWGEATREGCRALRKLGIHGLVGYFVFRNDEPAVSYYLDADHTRYMQEHDYWWDRSEDIIFVHHDIILNNFAVDCIAPELDRIAQNPHQSEVMELIIHEQYFRKDIPHLYQPDAHQKVITAIEWLTERGYKAVLYDEGFIGAPM